MKKLQIVRVDNDLVQKVDLRTGDNVISRKVTTGCKDGQIIRNAATINLLPNGEMTITPYQVAPCYMKCSGSSKWQLLKVGDSVPIKPGDICSLLPDRCWFKIMSTGDTMEKTDSVEKRKAEEKPDVEPPDKKLCSESDSVIMIPSCEKPVLDNGDGDTLENKHTAKEKQIQDIYSASSPEEHKVLAASTENGNNSEEIGDPTENPTELKAEANSGDLTPAAEESKNTDKNGNNSRDSSEQRDQSPVSVNQSGDHDLRNQGQNNNRREKCAYGSTCYRKNQRHKAKFSHPGDSDYDVSDDRPDCPYGVRCYRKNAQHKQQYKHTKIRTTRRRQRATPAPSTMTLDTLSDSESSGEESVDESEYEPSSANESSEGNSDWDESEESMTG